MLIGQLLGAADATQLTASHNLHHDVNVQPILPEAHPVHNGRKDNLRHQPFLVSVSQLFGKLDPAERPATTAYVAYRNRPSELASPWTRALELEIS